jgi:hypothetical protein
MYDDDTDGCTPSPSRWTCAGAKDNGKPVYLWLRLNLFLVSGSYSSMPCSTISPVRSPFG